MHTPVYYILFTRAFIHLNIFQPVISMRNVYALILFIAVALSAGAQTSFGEIVADRSKAAGLYCLYPVPVANYTKPPKGYKPFYISHYGRHGSRTLVNESDYSIPCDVFRKAYNAGVLTDLGRDVASRLELIWAYVDGRQGELTQRGVKQHHDIAQRMFRNNPGVFDRGAKITARSTVVMRCAHSMAAFCEGLKELVPEINIPRESGKRYMKYMANVTTEANYFCRGDGPAAKRISQFEEEMTKPARLMNTLFADSSYVSDNINSGALMRSLFLIAIDQPNTDIDVRLDDIFTDQELYDLWQAYNYRYYNHMSNPTSANGAILNNAKPLLKNLIESADKMIADGGHGADLRFGHDSCIVPLVGLMKIDGCYGSTDDPYKLAEVYADFKISPMAANLQMVFCRNKVGEVIVRLLLNEREVSLPLKSEIAPFYRWNDLRSYLEDCLDN